MLLEKNTQVRLLGGFWSFPIMETSFISQQLDLFEDKAQVLERVSQISEFEKSYALKPKWTERAFPMVKHTFSHQKWAIALTEGLIAQQQLPKEKELAWVKLEDMTNYPMATPQKKMLDAYLKGKGSGYSS